MSERLRGTNELRQAELALLTTPVAEEACYSLKGTAAGGGRRGGTETVSLACPAL